MPVSLVSESRVLRIGAIDSLLVFVWYSHSNLEALDQIEAAQRPLRERHPTFSILNVFTGTPKAPEPGVKERSDAMARESAGAIRINVMLVLAKGLGGVVVRTFLAGFSLLSPMPMQSAASLEEAVKKLQGAPGQTPELRGNTRLLQDLAAFIATPPPGA
jgi:hypothetical protein